MSVPDLYILVSRAGDKLREQRGLTASLCNQEKKNPLSLDRQLSALSLRFSWKRQRQGDAEERLTSPRCSQTAL